MIILKLTNDYNHEEQSVLKLCNTVYSKKL